MTELSPDDRELVREELAWLSKYLRRKYHWVTPQIREKLHEMIGVSI
jgi:hypothetical protein